MLTDGVGYVAVFTLGLAAWLVAVVLGSEIHDVVGTTFLLTGVYVFPALLTTYPVTGDVSETLTTSRSFDFAFSRLYATYFVVYIVLFVVLRVVVSLSFLLFVVGGAFGTAFSFMCASSYWGRVYHRAVSAGLVEPAHSADQRGSDRP
jgi:hypothetical protein